jgi:hypothetical protein
MIRNHETPTHVLIRNHAIQTKNVEFLALSFSDSQREAYQTCAIDLLNANRMSVFDAMKQVNEWIVLLLNERQVESGPYFYWELTRHFSVMDVRRLEPATTDQIKAWDINWAFRHNIPIGVAP